MLRPMGRFATLVCIGIAMASPRSVADAVAATGCVSSGDAAEAVQARRIVAPDEALSQARRAVPDSDILRATLCHATETLVYRIMALRRDGRLVRVTVDAPSGKVTAVH